MSSVDQGNCDDNGDFADDGEEVRFLNSAYCSIIFLYVHIFNNGLSLIFMLKESVLHVLDCFCTVL